MSTLSFKSIAAWWLVAFALLATAGRLSAGDWHQRDNNQCSDCHTQHNSENGQPMRTDNNPVPAPMLLRRATPLELCLSCHDGSNPSAPDVLAPVSYVTDAAGGSFPNAGGFGVDSNNSFGHHLNTPTPVIPPGGTQPMILICTTCHDPHGNGNYRNLKTDPTNTNQTPATVIAVQDTTANGTNPSEVYRAYKANGSPNVIYKSGISAWCNKCHTSSPHPASDDHPIDRLIWNAPLANYTKWTSTALPHVPVHSPTDDIVPSEDDQVMCLSCHKAHGSTNPSGLIYSDGDYLDSTCQECHDQ